MNELAEKISNYNIFNYLFPGIIVCFFLDRFGIYQILGKDIFVNGVVCYFIGLCISRVSSLLIEKNLVRIKFIEKRPYKEYVRASELDDKVELFSEISNSYRTLMLALLVIPIAQIAKKWFGFHPSVWHREDWIIFGIFIALSILFLFAHRKQNNFVVLRIDIALGKNAQQSAHG